MRRLSAGIAAIALGLCLSGCATVFEGTSQEITVVTNPPGALCVFDRKDLEVGRIANTPGVANVRKSKYDIMIKCSKAGYQDAQYLNHSGTSAAIAGNVAADLILTAGLSSIVDSADGADNKYDSAVNITLVPTTAATTASSPPDLSPPPTPAPAATAAPAAAASHPPEAAPAPKASGQSAPAAPTQEPGKPPAADAPAQPAEPKAKTD